MSTIIRKLKASTKKRVSSTIPKSNTASSLSHAKLQKSKTPLLMKSPPHPGSLVRDTLDEFGLSIADAASGLGVTRQQLNNICSGRSSITPDMAVRLEAGFGGSAEIWMKLQVAFDLAAARSRARASSVTKFSRRAA